MTRTSRDCYLTRRTRTDGAQVWAAFFKSEPLCADTHGRARAEAAARQYHLHPSRIWDGDSGAWHPIDAFPDDTANKDTDA